MEKWPFIQEEHRRKFVEATRTDNPAQGFKAVAESVGAATNLRHLGFRHTDIELAADMVVSQSFPNPAPINKQFVLNLLQDAYDGSWFRAFGC